MIRVETPRMTIGELVRHVDTHTEPVRRSTHVGNQPPRELAIMSGLPPGVDVLMVDTIQGDDRYTTPHKLIGAAGDQQLVSRNKASGRVVGSVRGRDPHTSELVPLTVMHQAPLDTLRLNNRPVAMMKFFRAYPDHLRATMTACLEANEVRREVHESGKIIPFNTNTTTIYGEKESVPAGALLPLNGMMVMDMLVSEEHGSNSTLHLGGADMTRYVADEERMSIVSDIYDKARAALGMQATRHTYRVLDSRGLACAVLARSQHELIENGESIDLEPHYHKDTGIVE